jgi:MFS transporter, OFA family, oxalate/formate antiporter
MSDSRKTINRWWQLVGCIAMMMAIANLQYAWTLFTVPLMKALGVKLAAVQLAFTMFILFETWLVPFEGWLIDRLGARAVVSAGSLLVGAAWVGAGMIHSLGGLYFWYAVGGVGAGAVYGACMGMALKWFPDHRGLAAGLTAGAYGFGTAITVIPIQRMIAGSGYQSAFILFGIVQGLIILAVAQGMRAPEAGWKPAGWKPVAKVAVSQSQVSYKPQEMVKSGVFYLMYFIMALVAFGGLMVTAQLKPVAASFGHDKTILLWGLSSLSLALLLDRILNGLTRPFWGWVSDHIGRYNTMGIAFGLEGLSKLALLYYMDDPVLFVFLTALSFFAWGEIFSLFPAAIGDVFGPKYATTNYGIQYTSKGLAAIFAGWGAAALMQVTGSWGPVFWVSLVCDLLAATLAFFLLKPLVAARMRKMAEVPAPAVGAVAQARAT